MRLLISRLREGSNICPEENAITLEQEEAESALRDLLIEESENDLKKMIKQCSMQEKEFPIVFDSSQTLPTVFEKSGFYIEGEDIVIDYGKYDHLKIYIKDLL